MIFQRLKDLKEDNELKQCNIAKIIGVSENTYGRYERGEKDITLEKALILADYYKISLDYIAGRTNDKKGLTKSELSEEETDIIKKIRSLSEKRKGMILGELKILFEMERAEEAQRKEVG